MIIWDDEFKFKTGDIIRFCNEEFEVIKNHGSYGTVKEHGCDNPETVNHFYWMYEDEKCVLVRSKEES